MFAFSGNCRANPWFRPIAAGGDGANIQVWYVGYDTLLQVGNVSTYNYAVSESSDRRLSSATKVPTPRNCISFQLLFSCWEVSYFISASVLTDTKTKQRRLDNTFFPGLPAKILVHDGFADQHQMSVSVFYLVWFLQLNSLPPHRLRFVRDLFAAVKRALDESRYKNVTIVGHSLGGALALISSLYLPTFFPNAHYRLVTYGMPRVGNKVLAQYLDNSLIDITRITNK